MVQVARKSQVSSTHWTHPGCRAAPGSASGTAAHSVWDDPSGNGASYAASSPGVNDRVVPLSMRAPHRQGIDTLAVTSSHFSMNSFAPSPLGMPVFEAMIRANRSGVQRGARWSPARPPQSWQYSVTSESPAGEPLAQPGDVVRQRVLGPLRRACPTDRCPSGRARAPGGRARPGPGSSRDGDTTKSGCRATTAPVRHRAVPRPRSGIAEPCLRPRATSR